MSVSGTPEGKRGFSICETSVAPVRSVEMARVRFGSLSDVEGRRPVKLGRRAVLPVGPRICVRAAEATASRCVSTRMHASLMCTFSREMKSVCHASASIMSPQYARNRCVRSHSSSCAAGRGARS